MIDLLLWLPLWALAIVLVIALVGFALASQRAFRRWAFPRMRFDTQPSLYFGAAAVQSAMVLYGLVAALTAVTVWTRHSQATDIVSEEATAIGSLWHDLGGYPDPERGAMRDLLRGYTNQIIERAWPEHRYGRAPRMGTEILDRFEAQLFSFEPKTEGQKILHAQTLGAYNRLIETRRQRLDAVDIGLPRVMWGVLLTGAFGCIALFLFFPVEDARYQSILLGGVATFIAMVLFVIVSLDRPFQGAMAIQPDSYELVRDHLMR